MDSRGLYYLIGSFALFACPSQCCDVNAEKISPTFNGLECYCGKPCAYGIQTCDLIRCLCPFNPDNYNVTLDDCSGSLCPHNCCQMIPLELRNYSLASHYMYAEEYQHPNNNESVQTIQIFTKLPGSTTARWLRTMVLQKPGTRFVYSSTALSPSVIADKVSNNITDFLDNQSEVPSEVLGVSVQSIEDSLGFSEQVQCHEGVNTSCNSKFCSCVMFSNGMSPPEDDLLRNITGDNIVYDIGNECETVITSTSLTPYHSIDVTKRSSDTIGGWAPFFNDTSPWVEFRNIKEKVCGVVIQGVDWTSSRRLDKFTVQTSDGTLIKSLEGQSYFMSGSILDSKSIHLFSKPVNKSTSLRINVLLPNNSLNVGFRASLITCGLAPSSCNDTRNDLVEATRVETQKLLANYSGNPSFTGMDQVDLVANIYHTLKTFLDEKFKTNEFPETSRIRVTDDIAETDIFFVDLNDLEETGYSFNNSDTGSVKDDRYVSVSIPANGFAKNGDTEVVIVTSVVGANVTEADVQEDEYGYQYKFSSPIVTVSVFVKDADFKHKQIINRISVTIPYKNTTTNPRVLYFQEADVKTGERHNVKWSTSGCNSRCDKFICEVTCDHATSFAVLQLLGESKLSPLGQLISSIITTIGCVVSIISLMVALVIYILFRSTISSAQYVIHSNLMVSLLLALCIFMTLMIQETSKWMCGIIKFSLQYFFSAAFCWMLCEGIHLYRQIITVFEAGSRYLVVYFIIGWAVPLLLVVVTIVGVTTRKVETPLHSDKTCFFSYKDGSIYYFVTPVLVITLINTGILVRVVLVVVNASKIQTEKNSSETLYQAKAGLRSALLLIPLLGCAYIIGFLASLNGAIEFAYNVINSLQGFFIALLYCVLNKEIRNAIKKYVQRSRDMSTIQASTTGLTLPKDSKQISASRNQIAPEPIKHVHLEETD